MEGWSIAFLIDERRFLSHPEQASIDFGKEGTVFIKRCMEFRDYMCTSLCSYETQPSENGITSVPLSRSPEEKQRFLINSPAGDSFNLILILTNVLISQPFYTWYYQFISLVSSLGDLPAVEIFDLYAALHFILSQLARI